MEGMKTALNVSEFNKSEKERAYQKSLHEKYSVEMW